MASCEMCGREASLMSANVEGVDLKVCQNCSKFGKLKSNFNRGFDRNSRNSNGFNRSPRANIQKEEPEYSVRDNYAQLIHSAREEKKLNQENFAKMLAEKESSVSRWENGLQKPGIADARKLEKILGIRLIVIGNLNPGVENKSSVNSNVNNSGFRRNNNELTLGDIRIKQRK